MPRNKLKRWKHMIQVHIDTINAYSSTVIKWIIGLDSPFPESLTQLTNDVSAVEVCEKVWGA